MTAVADIREEARAHAEAIERWRKARLERLTAPTSWLSLVDRIPIDEGDNALPIGTATLKDGVVRFRAAAGVDVRFDGQPVIERVLRSDEDGAAKPDQLIVDGRLHELVRRGDAFALRVKDPSSPARLGFRGLSYYPIDLAWRIEARFERFDPPHRTKHALDSGPGAAQVVPGLAHFTVDGKPVTLEPTIEEGGKRLYLIFADATNHGETYPGGRFLYADLPAGDVVVLDFNQAFNPPCAFTAFAICPAVPPRNRLPFAVTAGERLYVAG